MRWDPRSRRRHRRRNFQKDQSQKEICRNAWTTGLAPSREASPGAL